MLNIISNDHGLTQKCDFSAINWKHTFWATSAQKIKIVSLSWNWVPRLIPMCKIQWWGLLLLFLVGSTLFGKNLVQKMKIVNLSRNLPCRLIQICRIQWWCFLFQFLVESTLFGENLVQKIKIVSLSWNLPPRIIQIYLLDTKM